MAAAFAHDAVLTMVGDGDPRAPGAAITVALCGHWEHDPPCPLAPHHTAATLEHGELRVRALFVVEAGREDEVRAKIRAALAVGRLVIVAENWQAPFLGPDTLSENQSALFWIPSYWFFGLFQQLNGPAPTALS